MDGLWYGKYATGSKPGDKKKYQRINTAPPASRAQFLRDRSTKKFVSLKESTSSDTKEQSPVLHPLKPQVVQEEPAPEVPEIQEAPQVPPPQAVAIEVQDQQPEQENVEPEQATLQKESVPEQVETKSKFISKTQKGGFGKVFTGGFPRAFSMNNKDDMDVDESAYIARNQRPVKESSFITAEDQGTDYTSTNSFSAADENVPNDKAASEDATLENKNESTTPVPIPQPNDDPIKANENGEFVDQNGVNKIGIEVRPVNVNVQVKPSEIDVQKNEEENDDKVYCCACLRPSS
eukprot:TRINITY_DN3927_c0_g2_i1.p1 TRINITY_DN3927_c0_g2~~TRINITY_DN3927_c0_g2_i1.p1  ORF type:complete len:326 (-),score=62.34 TRINITY_DN3927_c0_g2_i1:241-1116(-)